MVEFNTNIFGGKQNEEKPMTSTTLSMLPNNLFLKNQQNFNAVAPAMDNTASNITPPMITQEKTGFNILDLFRKDEEEQYSYETIEKLYNMLSPNDQMMFELAPKAFLQHAITSDKFNEAQQEEDLTDFQKMQLGYRRYIVAKNSGNDAIANALAEKYNFIADLSDSDKRLLALEEYKNAKSQGNDELARSLNGEFNFADEIDELDYVEQMFDQLDIYNKTGNIENLAKAQVLADKAYQGDVFIDESGKLINLTPNALDLSKKDKDETFTNAPQFPSIFKDDKTYKRKLAEDAKKVSDEMFSFTKVGDTFQPIFLQAEGDILSVTSSWKDYFGLASDEEKQFLKSKTSFTAENIKNFNQYVKNITGAQMSENEVKRLIQAYPDAGFQDGILGFLDKDTPTEFKAKYDQILKVLIVGQMKVNYYNDPSIRRQLLDMGILVNAGGASDIAYNEDREKMYGYDGDGKIVWQTNHSFALEGKDFQEIQDKVTAKFYNEYAEQFELQNNRKLDPNNPEDQKIAMQMQWDAKQDMYDVFDLASFEKSHFGDDGKKYPMTFHQKDKLDNFQIEY
tara:strand:- start:829 stop:2529 length:1701 start_codon:yes stop_codon:yes gene_type:complete